MRAYTHILYFYSQLSGQYGAYYLLVEAGLDHHTHSLGYKFDFRKNGKIIKLATITVQKLEHARVINIIYINRVCFRIVDARMHICLFKIVIIM